MACGGLNQFLTLVVPADGDGPALDVSSLVAAKSIYLAGTFRGRYVIMGSLDGSHYVPIVAFDGGQGPQAIRKDVFFTLKTVKVRRQADKLVTVNIAAQTVCSC